MHTILSIETATKACSVALHEQGHLLGSQELHIDRSHSEYLAQMIKDLLSYTGKSVQDLSAIAVSKGPGSYTGLRIGVSTAKGLCYGLGIPLISVNSLLAMAHEVKKYTLENYDLCPMLDARRMEVYCMITDSDLNIRKETEAVIINETSFKRELKKGKILFFGDGMPKCREILGRNENACFVEDVHPKAPNIGYLACRKYDQKDFENTETFEPFYLKDFITTIPKKQI
jgi:tRNA threonylcarbamoyladenosine biosynthesis protein TsaB